MPLQEFPLHTQPRSAGFCSLLRSSAEVVHIDLGIAFDQGKLLPTPERVPFRLTRDVVDGMGISKTEGLFRYGCCGCTAHCRAIEEALYMGLSRDLPIP